MVNTQSLYKIAKSYGLDSVLVLSQQLPIYVIDSVTALKLLDFVDDYSFREKSGSFFIEMAHTWKNQTIKQKTYDFALKRLKKIESEKFNLHTGPYSIEDRLLIATIIQKPDSIEEHFINCYKHSAELAELYRKEFPSAITRIGHFFTDGFHPIVLRYKSCHMNCYKFMWALGQIGSDFYDAKKLSLHNSKQESWKKNPQIMRFFEPYREFDFQEIILNGDYNSIEELNFEKEPELSRILGLKSDSCRKTILYHNKIGFSNLICYSYGITHKIEILENNKIKLTIISEWF